MAGKGPQLRKGANLQKYWDHYDSIFRKSKPVAPHSNRDECAGCSPSMQTERLRIFYREGGQMFLADYADSMSDALQLASNICDWHPEDAVFIVNPQGDIVV